MSPLKSSPRSAANPIKFHHHPLLHQLVLQPDKNSCGECTLSRASGLPWKDLERQADAHGTTPEIPVVTPNTFTSFSSPGLCLHLFHPRAQSHSLTFMLVVLLSDQL